LFSIRKKSMAPVRMSAADMLIAVLLCILRGRDGFLFTIRG